MTPFDKKPDRPPDGSPWSRMGEKAEIALSDLIAGSRRDVPGEKVLQYASDESTVVYFPLSGWTSLSKCSTDGDRQIIDFLLPGDAFDPGSAEEHRASTDVTTVTDARIAVIRREKWIRYLTDHPEAWTLAQRLAGASFARVSERLLRIGKRKGETRVAYVMCELGLRASRHGHVRGATRHGFDAGTTFHLPLTQQLLGDFAGLSSVHVSRMISRLEKLGIISYGDHMDIVIHDMEALARIAEIDLDDLQAGIIIEP